MPERLRGFTTRSRHSTLKVKVKWIYSFESSSAKFRIQKLFLDRVLWS